MTLITLMPSGVAKKSVKSVKSVDKKLKTSLFERQDSFYYCLLIYLIYLKPGPRSKHKFNQ